MKHDKETLQKIFLGCLLLLGMIYCYFSLLLFPLQRSQAMMRKSISALEPEMRKAQSQIKRTQEIQRTAPEKTAVLAQVDAMIPEGSPIAWFPPKLAESFKRQGLDKVTTKFSSEVAESELPGYRRLVWNVDLQKVDFAKFGAMLCILENEEPLLEISNLQMEAMRDDAERQHASLTIQNLVKQ